MFRIMTDGYLIQVVHELTIEHFQGIGWTQVGNAFDDWKQANKHADKLARG